MSKSHSLHIFFMFWCFYYHYYKLYLYWKLTKITLSNQWGKKWIVTTLNVSCKKIYVFFVNKMWVYLIWNDCIVWMALKVIMLLLNKDCLILMLFLQRMVNKLAFDDEIWYFFLSRSWCLLLLNFEFMERIKVVVVWCNRMDESTFLSSTVHDKQWIDISDVVLTFEQPIRQIRFFLSST